MSKVAVVILNYNGKTFLETFLPSVIQNSGGNEVIVADNASTDDSVAFLHSHFPEVKLIQMSQNQGFAGGYNAALQQVQAQYYVLLNSDVEVTPNWIEPIIKLMDNDESIAACQPKILSYHEKTHFEYAGAAGGYIDWLGYPFCRGRVFDSYEKDTGQYNDTKEIFWATGACMFVRADVFHSLGGFDANFFAHMEEIDLCWRMKNADYKIMYSSESKVYHVGGGTLHKSNPRKTFLNYRNGLAMLYKNLPSGKVFYTILLRLILDGISGIKLVLDGQLNDCLAIIKAHFAFYVMIPKLERKKTKQVYPIYSKSIVWEYFVRKNKPQV
ncbi:glycosyl transferase family 2 [Emticicia oligotrophica DSM 17448]|uniref:Glycosyl transferase family 2 n=1 Tax=Emticicia oligotrophica (strain DSM 17448 / CIP 109782 / MTCC 6937 / GPTSA100-15) TaxID=929562 RepID=A0ABN4AP82_EMTOG|nr:glycosyltransferase family 2 protein [Emticicia oligotrophica]AFK04094.1 glycosyl transferase family 2 [Emticicia oligotrophica DSM 17448]